MRIIGHYTVSAPAAGGADGATEGVMRTLRSHGWLTPEPVPHAADLVLLAREVLADAEQAGRDLPTSPESHFIQDVLERWRTAPGRAASSDDDLAPYSLERLWVAQAILLLTQIDPIERADAMASGLHVVVGPDEGVFGMIFDATRRPDGGTAHVVRLRSNDLAHLQGAFTQFASALSPRRPRGRVPSHQRHLAVAFGRVEIRSVTNERLFTGRVVPLTGRLALLRQVLNGSTPRVLTVLSGVLVVLSALLHWQYRGSDWGVWAEEMVGRLATGAFGALLADTAIDYTTLRRSLARGDGPVTDAAVVHWSRAA